MYLKKLYFYKNKCDVRSHLLINQFEKIDESIIDNERSIFEEKSDIITFNIYRKLDESFPIHLEIGKEKSKNKFFLWFGFKENPIIEMYYENLSDDGLLNFTQELINNFLRSNITEKNTLVNNKIIWTHITGDKLKEKDGSPIIFGRKNKIIWFWQKREERKNYYKTWIS